MSRPPFPTVEWEIYQAKHELAMRTENDHDRGSECWCHCNDCSERFAKIGA